MITRAQLLSLDYFKNGLPFVRVEAKSMNTKSLDFYDDGLPFVGIWDGGTVEPPLPIYNASQFMVMF